jgi:hypothetical protein
VDEDDCSVVVFGTICMPRIEDEEEFSDAVECPYHVYLDRPLGDRTVIDAVCNEPVPYKNVYVEIQRRLAR